MKKVSGIIALLLLLVSCEKELDFRYHDVESQLVIEARTSEAGTSVSLTLTCPMDEPLDVTPVTDAEVTLFDVTGGVSRELRLNEAGLFNDATPGIVGHDYQIEVKRADKRFVSSSRMLSPTRIEALDFKWIKVPYDYVAVLQVTFVDLPSADDCYWIRIYRNGQPYKWLLSDDSSAIDGCISVVTMTSRQDIDSEDEKDILRDGDEVSVAVAPVSRAIYDYLVAIQSDSNGPRLFTGDFCLGYYIASTDAVKSIIFRPDEMEVFK